jgi:F-type H+-transporting ATPase subunit b
MERGKNREEEIIRQASREADAIREKASADIAREKKQAINDAKNEISSLAMEIAGKVVGESLDAARQEKLVNSFLEELGEQQ